MSFRPRFGSWAAVLALVVGVSAGLNLVRLDLERASTSAAHARMRPAAARRVARLSKAPRQGTKGPTLRFSPVNTAARAAATQPVAPNAAGTGHAETPSPSAVTLPPVARMDGAAAERQASPASGTAVSTVAPPLNEPAVVGEFAFRMEGSLRAQLDAVMRQSHPPHLQFPVADGRTVDLAITAHDAQDATRGVLYARVDADPLSQVVLAYVDEAVAGSIVTPEGELFLVRYAGGGVHRTYQLDPDLIPSEGEPLTPMIAEPRGDWIGSGTPPQSTPEVIAAPQTAADGPPPIAMDATDMQIRDGANTVIDMVIAYTPESRANNGGTSGINAVINASVAKANLAFSNSQAGILLRAVLTTEVSYTSGGNIGADLGAMQSATDGKMDNLYTLRTQYNADLVSLFVPSGQGGVVGMAYLLNPSTMGPGGYDWAFSVVVDWAADGNISFGHEVGHNLGAGHTSDGGCGVYSYACGYRFSVGGNAYRTVMAYSPGLRIPHFSNPNLTYLGAPLGTASTNNALTVKQGRAGLGRLKYGAADSTVSVQLDLNADTKPDLLVRNVFNSVVDAWTMDNATRTSSTTLWPASTAADAAWVPMASADFNSDSKPDILWRNTTTGRVIVWYMDGVNRLSTGVVWAVTTAADAAWLPMATGDFNADTKPDIIWRNMTTGRVIVWYMDGITRTGTAAIWAPVTTADADWVPLAAADFSADNKPDLIWRNQSTGRVIFWFMDGATRTGTFALWPATNPGDAAWRPMAVGDFNGDNQIDIVWRNTDTGRVIVWYMSGTTRVGTAPIWS